MEVPCCRAYRGPLGVANAKLDVADDDVLIDDMGHGAAELGVLEPPQLFRGHIVRARVGVPPWIHVEAEEGGAEGRAALVDGEVQVFL